MSGNVWEWVWDRYGGYSTTVLPDPVGPATGTNRVVRGGSWASPAKKCRGVKRDQTTPTTRDQYRGFRVARTAL